MADPARAKQVLINLLSNSVKFTDKGWITLRGRSFPERGFVELEVQDTGIGIAPAKQQHLFEKFQQLDSTFTRQQGRQRPGTGDLPQPGGNDGRAH